MSPAVAKSIWLWSGIGVVLGLGALWQLYPLADAAARLQALPEQGLMMKSEAVAVTPAETQIYHGATVLKRLVQVRGQRVVLTIIDGTRNRHAVHDPLFCFRGAGWDVLSEASVPLERGEGRRVTLGRHGEHAEAMYWFSDGTASFGSATTYWVRTTLRRVTLGTSGPEPVLVVLTSVDDRPVDWTALLAAWPELGAF